MSTQISTDEIVKTDTDINAAAESALDYLGKLSRFAKANARADAIANIDALKLAYEKAQEVEKKANQRVEQMIKFVETLESYGPDACGDGSILPPPSDPNYHAVGADIKRTADFKELCCIPRAAKMLPSGVLQANCVIACAYDQAKAACEEARVAYQRAKNILERRS